MSIRAQAAFPLAFIGYFDRPFPQHFDPMSSSDDDSFGSASLTVEDDTVVELKQSLIN